jgi:hypothetical protein
MYLCRRCIAYLAGPEEIIDPNSLGDGSPPVRTIPPSGRCACCGDTLGAEECFQEQPTLEDLAAIHRPLPDLHEGYTGKWAEAGAKVGGLAAVLVGIGGLLVEGPGFGFLLVFALGPCLVGFGILVCWAIGTALVFLFNRPRAAAALFKRKGILHWKDAPEATSTPEISPQSRPTSLEVSDPIQEAGKSDLSRIQSSSQERGL